MRPAVRALLTFTDVPLFAGPYQLALSRQAGVVSNQLCDSIAGLAMRLFSVQQQQQQQQEAQRDTTDTVAHCLRACTLFLVVK